MRRYFAHCEYVLIALGKQADVRSLMNKVILELQIFSRCVSLQNFYYINVELVFTNIGAALRGNKVAFIGLSNLAMNDKRDLVD